MLFCGGSGATTLSASVRKLLNTGLGILAMMSSGLETDPSDGLISLVDYSLASEVLTLQDVRLVLKGLHERATEFRQEHGYVGYPVLRFWQLRNVNYD